MSDDTPITPADMREAGINLLELMGPILETVSGYRAKALAEGFSETAAESMAMDLHYSMVRNMTSQ